MMHSYFSVGKCRVLIGASLFSLVSTVYGGSAPDVSEPVCVMWCGNEGSNASKSEAKPQKSKKAHPAAPLIDVDQMMDAAAARKKQSKKKDQELANQAAKIKQQQEAQQRAAMQHQQAEEQRSIRQIDIKGGFAMEVPNTINLKPIPAVPARSALGQLGCVANTPPDEEHSRPADENWESHTKGCGSVVSADNIAAKEASAKREEMLRKEIADLQVNIQSKQQEVAKLDQEISVKEQEVQAEQLKIKDSPEGGNNDALQRALEALAKAKADRQQTATELEKLEQQEQAAKKDVSSYNK